MVFQRGFPWCAKEGFLGVVVFSHVQQQLDAGAAVGLCVARIWPCA